MMGALPRWADPDDQLAALEALERDYYAASTVDSVRAKLRTISRALAGWSLLPFPPTLGTVRALAATLKRGATGPRRRICGFIRQSHNAADTVGRTPCSGHSKTAFAVASVVLARRLVLKRSLSPSWVASRADLHPG